MLRSFELRLKPKAAQRKKRRSSNRAKARETLHRAHQWDANARKNYLHPVSKWLVGGSIESPTKL
jgi:transposase